ncbi:hypothetical protein N2152v2_005406 [Parachlorella kessleri]
MEACLSALAALEACLSSTANVETEDRAAFWEAACSWVDATDKLKPGDEQGQLLRHAAIVATLLGHVMSKAASAWDTDGAKKAGSEISVPTPGTLHARADVAAAAAKAASGFVTLLKRRSPPLNHALLQQVTDGVVAVTLCFRLPAAAWQQARQLGAVVDLAASLLKPDRDSATCPASSVSALARAINTPGFLVALLRNVASRLAVEPASQGWREVRRIAYYVVLQMYCLGHLAEEYGRLVADEHLVQQLLSLVVLPAYFKELDEGLSS